MAASYDAPTGVAARRQDQYTDLTAFDKRSHREERFDAKHESRCVRPTRKHLLGCKLGSSYWIICKDEMMITNGDHHRNVQFKGRNFVKN